jgi:hypothetical protein
MKDKKEINTDAAPPPVIVRVRVLKNGLEISGCRCAKNARVNATAEAAAFHEARGEVTILGTA